MYVYQIVHIWKQWEHLVVQNGLTINFCLIEFCLKEMEKCDILQ